jgi:ribosomal protein L31
MKPGVHPEYSHVLTVGRVERFDQHDGQRRRG